ncbi:MAG: hypothetical protein H6730_05205 [Deltaproteobacteria bacterium]|nr:hypothetical protein [Deltaproteobacteria bacterium]
MRRIAFLSMNDLTDFVCDDDLARPALAERGFEVETVPWRADVDFSRYAAVIIRSTWDYTQHLQDFLHALRRIDAQSLLLNPLEVVEANVHKGYLLALEAAGVPVIPTRVVARLTAEAVPELRRALGGGELIVKPTVGANAVGAHRLPESLDADALADVVAACDGTELLVQPFLPNVLTQGEHSLFFFEGALSHAIVKVPKAGDFRVQEEHGGDIRPDPRPAPDLVAAAHRALTSPPFGRPLRTALGRERPPLGAAADGQAVAAVAGAPLYARVDMVRDAAGQPRLMELELVEPALYFRTDTASPGRFADALLARLGPPGGGV